jgi:hypothetical protein
MNDNDAVKLLTDLNIKLGDDEMKVGSGSDPNQIDQKAYDDLDKVLHRNLIFRRASGAVVDKEKYLEDLKNRAVTYDVNESSFIKVRVHEDIALVDLVLGASGKKSDGSSWQGVYRNTRVFISEDGSWKMITWFNTRIDDLPQG